MTPVHSAAASGALACLEALLSAGGSARSPDGLRGSTPLHWAAQGGSADCVRALLAAGAAADAENTVRWGGRLPTPRPPLPPAQG